MDAVGRAPGQVLAGGVEVGEVDGHLGLGPGQRLHVRRHLQAAQLGPGHAPQVDPGVQGVDGGHQQHIRIADHGPADGRPHPPAGPEHPHSDRHGERLP